MHLFMCAHLCFEYFCDMILSNDGVKGLWTIFVCERHTEYITIKAWRLKPDAWSFCLLVCSSVVIHHKFSIRKLSSFILTFCRKYLKCLLSYIEYEFLFNENIWKTIMFLTDFNILVRMSFLNANVHLKHHILVKVESCPILIRVEIVKLLAEIMA